jgi:hypothetical protein
LNLISLKKLFKISDKAPMMPKQNPMGFMNPMNYGMFIKPGEQNMLMMNSE